MRPGVKVLYSLGLLLLLGSPIGLVIATLVQAPKSDGHSSPGQIVAQLFVGGFAALPFMFVGGILLIIGVVLNRRRKLTSSS